MEIGDTRDTGVTLSSKLFEHLLLKDIYPMLKGCCLEVFNLLSTGSTLVTPDKVFMYTEFAFHAQEHKDYKEKFPDNFRYDYAVSREEKNAAGQKMPLGVGRGLVTGSARKL